MADSLRDQLLKAGLITEQQAEKAEQSAQRKTKRPAPRRSKKKKPDRSRQRGGEVSLQRAYAERNRLESKEREAEAQRKAEDLKRRQEANRKLKALVAEKSLNDDGADERRNYMYGNKIRHIYVTAEQQKQLNSGEIGIVVIAGRGHVVNAEAFAEVQTIKPEAAAFLADTSVSESESK